MKTIVTVQEKMSKVSAKGANLMQEATSSIRTVCSLSSQDSLAEMFEIEAELIYQAAVEFHQALGTSLGGFFFFIYGSYALALWYGSTLVRQDVITGKKRG
jgi:ATP-binding cassette, subfamily B (MDR/TAP), member 1